VWRLSDARSRWGSLSAKGVVGLNWRLVKASTAEMDYVICHELAHFRQRNHAPAFWREVAALCPDHEAARRQLRQNGKLYFQF
jgi:predicted metal-dependent hydrolase